MSGIFEKMQIKGLVEILQGYINQGLELLPTLVMAALVFFGFWLLSRGLAKLSHKFSSRFIEDPSIRSLIETTTRVLTIGFGVFVTAAMIFPGLEAGDLIGVLGLSSVAIGFAFKDIFQNFFAGILILTQRPFKIGDQIERGGIKGTVNKINIRYTTIAAFDGRQLIVPNAELYTNPVEVLTANQHRRTTFVVGIGYDEDIESAREIIHNVLSECDTVLQEPAPQVYVTEFGASSINFDVRYWTSPRKADVMKAQDQVATKIKYALDDAGIEIPYPYRSVEFVDKTDYVELAKKLKEQDDNVSFSGPRAMSWSNNDDVSASNSSQPSS